VECDSIVWICALNISEKCCKQNREYYARNFNINAKFKIQKRDEFYNIKYLKMSIVYLNLINTDKTYRQKL